MAHRGVCSSCEEPSAESVEIEVYWSGYRERWRLRLCGTCRVALREQLTSVSVSAEWALPGRPWQMKPEEFNKRH